MLKNFVQSQTSKALLRSLRLTQLAPVVRRLGNSIYQINHYPVDKCWQNKPRYPLDSVIRLSNNQGLTYSWRSHNFLLNFLWCQKKRSEKYIYLSILSSWIHCPSTPLMVLMVPWGLKCLSRNTSCKPLCDKSKQGRTIDPMQKWLPLNYSFVPIQNSLTNLVQDNKFFTIFLSKTRLVRLI